MAEQASQPDSTMTASQTDTAASEPVNNDQNARPGLLSVLRTRRFFPLFLTQFLGAVNDNLFKQAITLLILFKLASDDTAGSLAVVAGTALFILPYLLFSVLAGQLADRFDKAKITRTLKMTEVGAALVGILGLATTSIPILMLALFLFGLQSTLFSPSKYAMLPQHLEDDELVSGNALLEAGAFTAIITGLIVGGLLLLTPSPNTAIAIATLAMAGAGLAASFAIPTAPSQAKAPPALDGWKPQAIWAQLQEAAAKPQLFYPIVGIAWFNLLGGVLLAQLPVLARTELGASETMTTLLFVAFTIGIGGGALLTDKLLKGRITGQWAPIGLIIITVFMLDLAILADYPRALLAGIGDANVFVTILSNPQSWRLFIDLIGIAVGGALFVVPLYAMLQHKAEDEERARIIAASNVMAALFIVVGSGVAAALMTLGVSAWVVIAALAIANVFAASYAVRLVPTLIVRTVFRTLLRLLFRMRINGLKRLEKLKGPGVFVANHVSYIDGIILAASLPGRPVFAVHTHVAEKWWARPFLSLVDFKSLDPTNPLALKALIDEVKGGRSIVIFPEGRITQTGALMKVYEGPGLIAERGSVPLVPIRIDGPQFSKFSLLKGSMPQIWFPRVTVTIEEPIHLDIPEDIKGRKRRELTDLALYDALADLSYKASNRHTDIYSALAFAGRRFGMGSEAVGDIEMPSMPYRRLIAGAEALGAKLTQFADKGERIGVMLPTSIGGAVTFMALQAYGRVPAMLNFTAGASGVLKATEAGAVTRILTSRRFIEKANLEELVAGIEHKLELIYLEDLRPTIGTFDRLWALTKTFFTKWVCRSRKIDPDSPAVVLFTSGSEGAPKGVVLSHTNLLSNCKQIAARVDFTQRDKVLNALPMFHSFGLTGGTLLPLISGVPTFLYPSPLHYRVVPELAYSFNATIMFGTDTFLSGYARMAHAYDFYAMRYVFAGAERVRPETRRTYMEQFGTRIFEGYGTTETAPVIAVNTPMHNRPGTVGRLLPGMRYKLEDVPGVDDGGRLHVSGPNVMLGYFKIDNPGILEPAEAGPDKGTRWHDTGDIVEVDKAGYITIKGRAKRFAKIGGEMISLAAVEALAETAYPEIQTAVVSQPDSSKGEKLVICVAGEKLDLKKLRKVAKDQGMPELMVPKDQLVLEELPLLGTGKIDMVSLNQLVIAE